jgi:hypothetical protein
LNENRIQQVLEIEERAQAVRDAASKEADNLPIQAEREAQQHIDQSRADAEEEARKIIAGAQKGDDTQRIVAQAKEAAKRTEELAMTHFDRAVTYVLSRVIGKE